MSDAGPEIREHMAVVGSDGARVGTVLMAVAVTVACTAIGLAFMFFHIAVQNAVGAMSPPGERSVNFSWLALEAAHLRV